MNRRGKRSARFWRKRETPTDFSAAWNRVGERGSPRRAKLTIGPPTAPRCSTVAAGLLGVRAATERTRTRSRLAEKGEARARRTTNGYGGASRRGATVDHPWHGANLTGSTTDGTGIKNLLVGRALPSRSRSHRSFEERWHDENEVMDM